MGGVPGGRIVRGVERADAVLRVEATRHSGRAGRALDAVLLKEAIRQSDLLLVHYADPTRLSTAHDRPRREREPQV